MIFIQLTQNNLAQWSSELVKKQFLSSFTDKSKIASECPLHVFTHWADLLSHSFTLPSRRAEYITGLVLDQISFTTPDSALQRQRSFWVEISHTVIVPFRDPAAANGELVQNSKVSTELLKSSSQHQVERIFPDVRLNSLTLPSDEPLRPNTFSEWTEMHVTCSACRLPPVKENKNDYNDSQGMHMAAESFLIKYPYSGYSPSQWWIGLDSFRSHNLTPPSP
jgi:hypothetical protein